MLQPFMHILQNKKIILASSSPRRKQILELLGFPFEIKVSDFEENLNKKDFIHPYEYAKETAKRKAVAVAKKLMEERQTADLIIGADTVVAMNNQIYEKPQNRDDAILMLTNFSGKVHTVYTGVALIKHVKGSMEHLDATTFYEETDVIMGKLTPEIVEAYVDTGEPMDKAGGYGIQGIGASLIEGVHGDYYNVMGFPLFHFSSHLTKMITS